jgi:nucleoid-associated protein YgaU
MTAPLPAVIVEKGDTLWAIAHRELGRSSAWPILAAANKIADPKRLQPGDLIVVGPGWGWRKRAQ